MPCGELCCASQGCLLRASQHRGCTLAQWIRQRQPSPSAASDRAACQASDATRRDGKARAARRRMLERPRAPPTPRVHDAVGRRSSRENTPVRSGPFRFSHSCRLVVAPSWLCAGRQWRREGESGRGEETPGWPTVRASGQAASPSRPRGRGGQVCRPLFPRRARAHVTHVLPYAAGCHSGAVCLSVLGTGAALSAEQAKAIPSRGALCADAAAAPPGRPAAEEEASASCWLHCTVVLIRTTTAPPAAAAHRPPSQNGRGCGSRHV